MTKMEPRDDEEVPRIRVIKVLMLVGRVAEVKGWHKEVKRGGKGELAKLNCSDCWLEKAA